MESDKQIENSKPWLWKKGQSGNLKGRPKGKTMKEWAREYLERMTDEERDEFLDGMPKEIIWKMSEGNPRTDTDITSGGKELPQPILNTYVLNNDKPQENIKDVQEDSSSAGGNISIEDNINPIVVNSDSSNGEGEDIGFSRIGEHTPLETRSDARLQEYNASTPILDGFELERNG